MRSMNRRFPVILVLALAACQAEREPSLTEAQLVLDNIAEKRRSE